MNCPTPNNAKSDPVMKDMVAGSWRPKERKAILRHRAQYFMRIVTLKLPVTHFSHQYMSMVFQIPTALLLQWSMNAHQQNITKATYKMM